MPSLAKKWFEQGKEKGIEKGIEKGMEKGIEKGMEKGAFLKAVETCKNALRSGISSDTVALITGLSKEKVLEIQKEMKQFTIFLINLNLSKINLVLSTHLNFKEPLSLS